MNSRIHENRPHTILGNLSPKKFLKEFWNKKPLLIRQALPQFESPVSKFDLFNFSKNESVESRLVIQHGSKYSLKFGPFSRAVFESAPSDKWTLLVQDVDKHLGLVAGFRSLVDFIPSWMFDDIMMSYAADGGSVGPHVDKYSVFLMQASGKRKWMIDQTLNPDLSFRARQDLRILKSFKPTDSWVLEPGDVLYLPPNVPHHGVAVGECTTWSFGFRSPSKREIIQDIVHSLTECIDGEDLFDQDLTRPCEFTGEISSAFVKTVRRELESVLNPKDFSGSLGEILSRPKNLEQGRSRRRKSSEKFRVGQRVSLKLRFDLKVAFTTVSGATILFVNGQRFELGSDICQFARQISSKERSFDGKIATEQHLKAISELADLRHLLILNNS